LILPGTLLHGISEARESARPMERLLPVTTGEVVLAACEHDHMVTREQLTRLHSKVEIIPNRGHNVHVEDPRAVWELIARHAL
jgi:pimeloyl-ACP methyl ester carboxylesterase